MPKSKLVKSTPLSDFFRNATEDEARKVWTRVIKKTIKQQNKIIKDASQRLS